MPSAHAHERLRTLPRFRIGHTSDFRGLTGCTVVLCEAGAVCGVDVRGSAAGTRELEPCRPGHIVERVHAVLLTGGSAFGLDAAAGVMRYLERRGVGFAAGRVRVPIVPAAVIFDLGIGSARARPDAKPEAIFPQLPYVSGVHPVLARVSSGCPGHRGGLPTCYSPVRGSAPGQALVRRSTCMC